MTARPRETHYPNAPWLSPQPTLLATGARDARHHLGPCVLCGRAILAEQRAADLADGQGTIHVSCAARGTR